MRAMQDGKIGRIEELTRIPAEVQDTLITILSEKTLPIPELNTEVQARKGFNVIATANNRDKGVNELSSALMRRFNTVVLPVPDTLDEEVEIVDRRVAQLGRALELPAEKPALEEIRRVVTIFRELRDGVTADGKTKLKSPSGTLSTAEAISVVNNGLAMAALLRRRRAARRRPGRRPHRRDRQRPGAGSRRLAGIPGDGRQGARRLERPLSRLPRGALSREHVHASFGIRHHGPGCARSLREALERARSRTSCWSRGRPTRRTCCRCWRTRR